MIHTNERFVVGEKLRFTENVAHFAQAGDLLEYLGQSRAKVLTGPSVGRLVTLTIMAKVEGVGK